MDSLLGSHTQRGVTLEVLKDDLATYRKILQSALVQLIDREYADFVHLSSSLVRDPSPAHILSGTAKTFSKRYFFV